MSWRCTCRIWITSYQFHKKVFPVNFSTGSDCWKWNHGLYILSHQLNYFSNLNLREFQNFQHFRPLESNLELFVLVRFRPMNCFVTMNFPLNRFTDYDVIGYDSYHIRRIPCSTLGIYCIKSVYSWTTHGKWYSRYRAWN